MPRELSHPGHQDPYVRSYLYPKRRCVNGWLVGPGALAIIARSAQAGGGKRAPLTLDLNLLGRSQLRQHGQPRSPDYIRLQLTNEKRRSLISPHPKMLDTFISVLLLLVSTVTTCN